MFTQNRMDYVAQVYLLSLALLINFSLFQYLAGLFFNRRAQPLTVLLLLCAFVGFAAMVPFSIPDLHVFECLNDVSETASTLTFLVQIVILGRDICKKVKLRSLAWITRISELIIAGELGLILLTMFKIAHPELKSAWLDTLDLVAQDVALWFIFAFRFVYISMARGGFQKTLRTRRLEIFLYLLFATNEYPFLILNACTDVVWDPVQACWHRLTLLSCIVYTIRDKYRSGSGSSNKTTNRLKSTHAHHGTTLTKIPSKQSVEPIASTGYLKGRTSQSTHTSRGPTIRAVSKLKLGVSFKNGKSIVSTAAVALKKKARRSRS